MGDTAESERKKYADLYAGHPGYGRVGHANKLISEFISRAEHGATVGDFGCGRGAAFPVLIQRGFSVIPIDHVDAILPEYRTLPGVAPLHKANLWAGDLPLVNYGICADVMEHIPPEFVDSTLDNIAVSIQRGCLWTICHVKDVWGDRIGTRLHLTIQPEPWWTEKLENYWWEVKVIRHQPGMTVYWTEHLSKK